MRRPTNTQYKRVVITKRRFFGFCVVCHICWIRLRLATTWCQKWTTVKEFRVAKGSGVTMTEPAVNKPPNLKIRIKQSVGWDTWHCKFETFLSAAVWTMWRTGERCCLISFGRMLTTLYLKGTSRQTHLPVVVKQLKDYCTNIKNVIVENVIFNNVVQGKQEPFD